MSRLIFSNNIGNVNKFNLYCNNAGFTKYDSYSKNGVYGSVFKKLKIDDDNFLLKDGCAVAIVGTCFFDGLFGKAVLERILSDCRGGVKINQLRKKMNGAYACVIISDNFLYAFGDATGIYYYYYSYDNQTKEWVIGTSLYGLAKASGKTNINELNIIEECFQGCVIGPDTIIDDFFKIEGDYCIVVNLLDNTIEKTVIENEIDLDQRDEGELIQDASEKCRQIAKLLKDNLEKSGVSLLLTGGLDSRIIISSLLSEGITPAAYYGTGNSPLAPTTHNDLVVVKQYCERFKLPLHELDWSMPEKIDTAWDKYIEKYGEIGTMYASSPIVYEGMENIKEDIVLLGSFGEVYRNHFLVEKQKSICFSIDQVLDHYYLAGRDMKSILGKDYQAYRNRLEKKWTSILKPYLINNKLPKDYFSLVEYCKRRYSDAIVVNFLNQTRYSFSMLSEPEIVKFSFIPTEKKDNAGFIIKLTNVLYPEVLNIPIYSRYKFQKIDWNKMELISNKETGLQKLIKIPFVRSFFKKVKTLLKVNKTNTYMPEDMIVVQTKNDITNQVNDILKKVSPRKYSINVNNSDYLPKDVKYAFLATMASNLNIKQ